MKIVNNHALERIVSEYRADGKRIVFTNGCFDIVHAGHVRYLAAARKLGDCLIVGLNSDQSVRVLKGADRPINNEADRAEVMAALAAVDHVVIFSQPTAEALIDTIQPDIYVKGGDYQEHELPEAPLVARYGGEIVLVPAVPGRSSSNIIRRIQGE